MAATVEISPLEQRTLAKVKRYMFLYVLLGQIFYQFDRTNIGFAQLTMGRDLHLTGKAFGLASSIMFISMFLMQFPAGLAFEKFGAKRWLTFIMAGWGIVSFLQAFVTTGGQLSTLRFLLGIFEAGFMPGTYLVISIWFRGKNHGTAMSAMLAGIALAGILGSPYAGWVLGKHFLGLTGWRLLFLSEGLVTMVLALIGWFILADGPERASWLKPEERKFMVNYIGEYQAQKVASGVVEKSSVWAALKDFRIIMLFIGLSLSGFSAQVFTFFIPTLLKTVRAGTSNQYVGWLAIGPPLLYGIVAYTWGKHADRTEPTRHWHTVLPVLVSAVAILLFPLAKVPLAAMLCLALVQGGTAGWFVNFWPVANMVVGKKTIAKSTAFINSGNMALNFLGPIFFGWTMDITGKPMLGMYTCFGVLLVTFVVMNVFFFRYKAQLRKTKAARATAG